MTENCSKVLNILKKKMLRDVAFDIRSRRVGYMNARDIFFQGDFEKKNTVTGCLVVLEIKGIVERKEMEGLDGQILRYWRVIPTYYYPTEEELLNYLSECGYEIDLNEGE